jgi:HAMP domain-containing protein
MNTSINKKLMLGLLPVIGFFLLQGVLVWLMGGRSTDDVSNAVRKNTVASSLLADASASAQQIRRYEKEYFIYVNDVNKRNGYIKEWTGTHDKLKATLETMLGKDQDSFSPSDRSEIVKWGDALKFYSSEMQNIFKSVDGRTREIELAAARAAEAAAAPKPAAGAKATAVEAPAPVVMFTPVEVNTMIGPGKDRLSAELIKGVSTLSKAKTEQTLGLPTIAREGFSRMLNWALATVAIGTLLTLFVLMTLPKTVRNPIASLTAMIEGISLGKVDNAMPKTGVAEFSDLEKGVERLRQSQKIMLDRMRGGARA